MSKRIIHMKITIKEDAEFDLTAEGMKEQMLQDFADIGLDTNDVDIEASDELVVHDPSETKK